MTGRRVVTGRRGGGGEDDSDGDSEYRGSTAGLEGGPGGRDGSVRPCKGKIAGEIAGERERRERERARERERERERAKLGQKGVEMRGSNAVVNPYCSEPKRPGELARPGVQTGPFIDRWRGEARPGSRAGHVRWEPAVNATRASRVQRQPRGTARTKSA